MLKAYPRQRFSLSLAQSLQLAGLFLRGRARTGDAVKAFEKAFSTALDVPHAIAFNSSRAGIYLALKHLDLQPGDEVICQSYTFFVVPAVIRLAGLKPVFVDVNPETFNMDPGDVEKAITPRTRVLIVTHLHGVPAPLDPLLSLAEKNGLRVIEDCAHATGMTYRDRHVGTRDIGCFSLGIGKNLSTVQGGLLTTRDDALAARLRQEQDRFRPPDLGAVLGVALNAMVSALLTEPRIFRWTVYPVLRLQDRLGQDWVDRIMDDPVEIPEQVSDAMFTRMSNLQATLGLWRVGELPEVNRRLQENARAYHESLPVGPALRVQQSPDREEGIHMHYTVRAERPREFRSQLLRHGWDTQVDYCCSCADLPAFRDPQQVFPVSRELEHHVIFLPNYPDLSPEEIRRVARKLDGAQGKPAT